MSAAKKIVVRIEAFEGWCGYSYWHELFCNGGHNCKHMDALHETVNGKKVGFC